MNWGHKILIVIILFMVSMLTMVYIASQQTNDMMDKNYYEQELKYQSLIDAAGNLNAISKERLIQPNAEGIPTLHIPSPLIKGLEQGQLEFLSNANKNKDLVLPFVTDSLGIFVLPTSRLSGGGSYKVRIRWQTGGKNYYREEELTGL